jgi:prepilin-type N-terminal cleavage/methylation domain-containing protein
VRAGDRGFSLVEVLVASTVIAVGFSGLTGMLALSSSAAREGRYHSMAVALADERVEHLRAARWDGAGDCLGLSPSHAEPPLTDACPGRGAALSGFPDEPAGSLPSPFEQFSRQVRVAPCAGAACPIATADLRLVAVTVSYPPAPGWGGLPSPGAQNVRVTQLMGRRR